MRPDVAGIAVVETFPEEPTVHSHSELPGCAAPFFCPDGGDPPDSRPDVAGTAMVERRPDEWDPEGRESCAEEVGLGEPRGDAAGSALVDRFSEEEEACERRPDGGGPSDRR